MNAYTVYIDASEGFKSCKRSGIAICYGNRFIAYPIMKYGGINGAEMEAFKLAKKSIVVRPLLIITDSLHVAKWGKGDGIEVKWVKRNSCEQMNLVDTLSKLVARTGNILKGFYREGDEAHYYKRLIHATDKHFGRVQHDPAHP